MYAQKQQGQGIIPNITIRNAHARGYAEREVTQLGSFSYVYTFCSMKERVGVSMVRRTRDFAHDPRKRRKWYRYKLNSSYLLLVYEYMVH